MTKDELFKFRSSGGKARSKALTPERRKEIALKAGMANKARIEKLKKGAETFAEDFEGVMEDLSK